MFPNVRRQTDAVCGRSKSNIRCAGYASNALINWVLQGHADDPVPVMQRSAAHARAALHADPHDAEVLALAAYTLFQLERYAEALQLYARAETVFLEVAVAIRRIVAICHVRTGNFDLARGMPSVGDPITPNEHFLISRYRDEAFREALYEGIALVRGASA